MIDPVSQTHVALRAAICAAATLALGGCAASVIELSETQGQAASATMPAETNGFEAMMTELAARVEARAMAGIPVPIPADAGGGYTHEQHKQNAKTVYEAGMLYQQTGATKYRVLIRDILFDYADLYPDLTLHPEATSSNKGRLFWQGLNEAWWLVYTIQGYDAVRTDLSDADRLKIEDGVFNPMADFLSTGSPQTFDRIHNHATWATAGVGMTGYALGQPERVEQALYGLDKSGKAGFLRQLDLLFSPDGYYAEGPYYQRYALMPFVLFSQAIEQNEPERKIFEHRDGIVLKAIRSTVQQSYAGLFFPINDAIREKGINTVELKYGLAIAYEQTGDPEFLGAAQLQNGVVPTPGGKALLEGIAAGKAKPYQFASEMLRDGPDGTEGALIVLRSGPKVDDAAIIMKATTQGLGHGHFDKLGLLYYDNGQEVVADYGAARFLNVEPKNGGRYLPENETWAKQSVAHNTLVVDERSHFGGDWRTGQKFSPAVLAYGEQSGVQVASAEISTAYGGVNFRRTIAMVPKAGSDNPYIVDIVQAASAQPRQYDLPIHFKGQLIETGFDVENSTTELRPLGAQNGYQHLWDRARSNQLTGTNDLSWLLGDQFYTMTFAVSDPVKAVFTELGANDPNNNLRREQAVILRSETDMISFVTVYERHGRYDSDNEVTVFNGSSIQQIDIHEREVASQFEIKPKNGDAFSIFVATDASKTAQHMIDLNGASTSWQGAVHVQRDNQETTKSHGRAPK